MVDGVEELTPADRQRLQRLLEEIGNYQAAAEIIRQQITLSAASLSEILAEIETLRALKELKLETEVLVAIGPDSFVPARLAPLDKVIVGLGAGVAAERGVDEAINMLNARSAEVEQAMEQARQELEKLGERIESLKPEVERILEKAKKK
ncbi:MAG: prefoldin subunit alpha [Hadesarchaea archaeon]|nr:prefoldin subunit alpha [Hadesarchaea archaeon]